MPYVALNLTSLFAKDTGLFTSIVVGLLIAGTAVCADHVASSFKPSGDDKPHSNNLKGHLRPLGEQGPKQGMIDTVEGFVDPETFYKDYVFPSKPVLFKRTAHEIPAFRLWSDTYLSEKYGSLVVEAEIGKKESREKGLRQLTFSQFLHQYNDSDIYLVQDVPPEMKEDLILPRPLHCGGFSEVIFQSILWFSSGGTTSVLHHDGLENINCILDGNKSLIFFDKKYVDEVEDEHYVTKQSFSKVDVDSVDLLKHPGLADLPWWGGFMEKGDCLYIPVRWYHAVLSSKSRNMAVNLWFQSLAWFNHSDCAGCCKDTRKLSSVPIRNSVEILRHDVFSDFAGLNDISMAEAMSKWGCLMDPSLVQRAFELIDMDKDMVLTWEEVFNVDISKLVRDFPELKDEDVDVEGHDEL